MTRTSFAARRRPKPGERPQTGIQPMVGWTICLLFFMLTACSDRLVMTERTGFNLAVTVLQDPATPLAVNAGLDRRIKGFVPARRTGRVVQGESTPAGEAVSLFSGFHLEYKPPESGAQASTSMLDAELTIETQFASGAAAVKLAGSPEAVAEFVDVKDTDGRRDRGSTTTIVPFENVADQPQIDLPPPVRNRPLNAETSAERALFRDDLRQIQRGLCFKEPGVSVKGYTPGIVDGDFGPRTRAAIKDFRKKHASTHRPPVGTEPDQLDTKLVDDLLNLTPCPKQFASYFERATYTSDQAMIEADKAKIEELQRDIGVQPPFGRFDLDTREKIMECQGRNEVKQTGIVDRTFRRLSKQSCEA